MVKTLAAIGLAVVLMVCLVMPVSAAAKHEEEMGVGNVIDLSMLKMPTAELGGGSQPMSNPHGTPPGLDKPDTPDDGDTEPSANKWAVVVGIADYQGRSSDLWNPDDDAREMQQALINDYGFPKDNIKMLLNRKATAQAIINAIDWLAVNEDADSTVVFFFSGHGFRAADDEGWDSDAEDDGYDEGIVTYDIYGLPDGMLKTELSALDSQKVAMIFGSCHSGGMFDDDNDLQQSGRVILSACKADQYGWDYLGLGNTLFGYYCIDEGILDGLADTNGDGVSMEEALNYSYLRVTAMQPDSEPQISDGFTGEMIL